MTEAGGFNCAKLQYADWGLWYELWKRGALNVHVDEILWEYRSHGGNAKHDPAASRAAFFAAYPELA